MTKIYLSSTNNVVEFWNEAVPCTLKSPGIFTSSVPAPIVIRLVPSMILESTNVPALLFHLTNVSSVKALAPATETVAAVEPLKENDETPVPWVNAAVVVAPVIPVKPDPSPANEPVNEPVKECPVNVPKFGAILAVVTASSASLPVVTFKSVIFTVVTASVANWPVPIPKSVTLTPPDPTVNVAPSASTATVVAVPPS
mgnify:CR=1 FL=1